MVKRYLPVAGPVLTEGSQTAYAIEAETGPYVLYSDYAALHDAVEAHNADCVEICKNSRRMGNCKPYADRGMKCPSCPREWAVSVPNSAAPIPAGSDTGGDNGSLSK